MKGDYYLKDSFNDRSNLVLLFYKGFYYDFALLDEGLYKLTLFNAKANHLNEPIFVIREKFNIEINSYVGYEEVSLINKDGNVITIQCESVKTEAFSDTKEDLIAVIQNLEKEMHALHSKNMQKSDFISKLQSFYQKQLDKSEIVLANADWLSEIKRVEEYNKVNIYKQVLNFFQGVKND